MQPIIHQLTKNSTQMKKDTLANTKQTNIATYGCRSNPSHLIQKNLENIIINMTRLGYLHQTSQMSYCDLCRTMKLPEGIGITLGLGLKFCIQSNTPPAHLNKSYPRFVEDVWKRYIFAGYQAKGYTKEAVCQVSMDARKN